MNQVANADFQIVTSLLCDDVRREATGQEILIGVYQGRSVLPAFPHTTNVCIWSIVRWIGTGSISVGHRVIGTKGEIIDLAPFTARAIAPGLPSSMWIKNISFTITAPGNLQFQWRKPGANWEKALDFVILSSAQT